MNPELVNGADLEEWYDIPIIHKPKELIIPESMTPYSNIQNSKTAKDAICFNVMDEYFSDILRSPDSFIDDFKNHLAILSPDCSMFTNAPLLAQLTNLYRNRVIGSYYQRKGLYVIPHVRWGDFRTYTNDYFRKPIAFLGVEPESIVAVSHYGCYKTEDEKLDFEEGLSDMFDFLSPKVLLVYGTMERKIFKQFEHFAQLVCYPDWISRKKRGLPACMMDYTD